MKKIIAIIMLILMSTMVLAQGQGIHEPGTGIENPELKEEGQGTGQGQPTGEPQLISAGDQAMTQKQTEAGEQSGETIRARNRELLQTGLENALSRVKNENARQRLQQNLEKFQEKYAMKLQRMQGVEIEEVDEETGEATIKTQEPVRWFGLIKGTAAKRYQMDAKGNINEKAPWYRFMYAEDTTEEVAEETTE